MAVHALYKTGLLPTDPDKPILELGPLLTGVTPAVPASEDRFAGATFGLYGNDTYGDCGPTSVCNLVRLVSRGLTGVQVTPSQNDCFTLYKQSGNPNFPKEDNGVEMGQMLDALLEHGVGDGKGGVVKPVAFGRTKDTSDVTISALVAIFGGCLFAVTLQEAQQAQTDATPPKWDYKKTGLWGGHAIVCGKYDPEGTGVDAPVISWEKQVETTDAFRSRQLDEVWCVVFPWHLEHPAFLEGIDLPALQRAYKELTGKALPVPPAPAPQPEPVPVPPPVPGGGSADSSDRLLWQSVGGWAAKRHYTRAVKEVVASLEAWAKAKGLES